MKTKILCVILILTALLTGCAKGTDGEGMGSGFPFLSLNTLDKRAILRYNY